MTPRGASASSERRSAGDEVTVALKTTDGGAAFGTVRAGGRNRPFAAATPTEPAAPTKPAPPGDTSTGGWS